MSFGKTAISPVKFAMLPANRPVLSTNSIGGRGLSLERFRNLPSTVDVPSLGSEVVVVHLAGPVLIEQDFGLGKPQRRWVDVGQMSIVPAGQMVRSTLKGRADVVLLRLAPELLQRMAAEVYSEAESGVALESRFAITDGTIGHIARLLLMEAEAPGPTSRLMIETLGEALVIHLLRFHSNRSKKQPTSTMGYSTSRIRRVIEQMRSCLEDELSLSQLALTAGLSSSQLTRTFHDAVGMPPHRYLNGLRIAKARELLENTDLPLVEVAFCCGFGQSTHFATSFRLATGFSPRAWRQARRL